MINLTLINQQIFIGTYPQNDVDLERLQSGPKITAVLNLQTDADFKALRLNWAKIKQGYLDRNMRCERWPIADFSPEDLELRLEGAVSLRWAPGLCTLYGRSRPGTCGGNRLSCLA